MAYANEAFFSIILRLINSNEQNLEVKTTMQEMEYLSVHHLLLHSMVKFRLRLYQDYNIIQSLQMLLPQLVEYMNSVTSFLVYNHQRNILVVLEIIILMNANFSVTLNEVFR